GRRPRAVERRPVRPEHRRGRGVRRRHAGAPVSRSASRSLRIPRRLRTMKLLNCLVTGIALAAAPLLAQDLVAVRAGKILTMTGNTLEDAVILIENGKITQIGRDLEVPWN